MNYFTALLILICVCGGAYNHDLSMFIIAGLIYIALWDAE